MAAKLVPFEMMKDANNQTTTLTLRAPQYVDATVLAAGVAETITVPTGAKFVVFSANGNFYANFTTTATVAGADITNGTGSFLNPAAVKTTGITSFSIIAPAATIVTMAWFS